MATALQDDTAPTQASFRDVRTGRVVETGRFHDISCLPGGDACDLDAWEAGFTDVGGRFYTRAEAARTLGLAGHLESESHFAGAASPTLEAGHRESWRKRALRRAA